MRTGIMTERLITTSGGLWVGPDLFPFSLPYLTSNADVSFIAPPLESTVAQIKQKSSMASKHLEKVRDVFEKYDTDRDDSLSVNQVADILLDIGPGLTGLPAVRSRFFILRLCVHGTMAR
jgi:hypothetical protein